MGKKILNPELVPYKQDKLENTTLLGNIAGKPFFFGGRIDLSQEFGAKQNKLTNTTLLATINGKEVYFGSDLSLGYGANSGIEIPDDIDAIRDALNKVYAGSFVLESIKDFSDKTNNYSIAFSSGKFTTQNDKVVSKEWDLRKGDSVHVVSSRTTYVFLLSKPYTYLDGSSAPIIQKYAVENTSIDITAPENCVMLISFVSTTGSNYSPDEVSKYNFKTLNDIFSQDSTSFVKTITVELQGGDINADGSVKRITLSRSGFMNYLNTPEFINASEIVTVDRSIGELKIFCYDKEFRYLGTTESTLLPNTRWIKLRYSKDGEFGGCDSVNITVVTQGMRNAKGVGEPLTRILFSFDVQGVIFDEEVSDDSANLDNHRYFDNGTLILPPNYDNVGEAVPLVIFIHGTGGHRWNGNSSYQGLLEFVAKNGYAVADCCGMTDKYSIGDNTPPISDARWNNTTSSCFCNLYKFLLKNYNLKSDGCYVFGKSNGGLGTAMFSLTRPFPIKASATLAGSLSIVESLRFTRGGSLQYWLDRLNVEVDASTVGETTYLYSVESRDYNEPIVTAITENAHIFAQIDAFVMGSNIDADELAKAFFTTSYNQTANNTAVQTIIDNSWKIQSTPMKIFHALDDTSVPYGSSKWYVEMCRKTNSPVYLRTIPSGLGGHHAVDNDERAPKTTYTTKFGETVEIVTAYAELVEWFNRW